MTALPRPPPREITRPKIPPPPKACDTHANLFGPADKLAHAEDRSYPGLKAAQQRIFVTNPAGLYDFPN
ncbi:MAG TPA: hypothetical protein VJR30_15310 [Bradyrhizobium sp.]|nr:hypothetical protein [Bradyrhizobium sp.]